MSPARCSTHPTIQAVEVGLWLAQMFDVDEPTLDLYRAWLTPEERQRLSSFLNERRTREFIVGRGLLRRALAPVINREPHLIVFAASEQGKLVLDAPPEQAVQFNVTHTADLVACATCRTHPVGIDVEKINARVQVMDIAQRFFSADECAHMLQLDDLERRRFFFTVWTLKEALAKAHGFGLAAPLESSQFDVSPSRQVLGRTDYEPFAEGAWLASSEPSPEHRLALCVLCGGHASVVIRAHGVSYSGDISAERLDWAEGRLEYPLASSAGIG